MSDIKTIARQHLLERSELLVKLAAETARANAAEGLLNDLGKNPDWGSLLELMRVRNAENSELEAQLTAETARADELQKRIGMVIEQTYTYESAHCGCAGKFCATDVSEKVRAILETGSKPHE